MIEHFLREDTIQIKFSSERHDPLKDLIRELPVWCFEGSHRHGLLEQIRERHLKPMQWVREGVAFLGCRYAGVSLPVAAMGIFKKGFPFEFSEQDFIHLLIVLILPESGEAESVYKKVFDELRDIFYDRFLQERIKISSSPKEVYTLLFKNVPRHLPIAVA